LFNHNDITNFKSASPDIQRRAMRLIFEGNASEEMASIARGFIAELTCFYSTAPATNIEAQFEARRIGATLYEMTRMSVPEMDAASQPAQAEPFPEEG